MTFETFEEFTEWCMDYDKIDSERQEEAEAITLKNLYDTSGMVVCETMVYAYDSGFVFGAMMHDREGGLLVIQKE